MGLKAKPISSLEKCFLDEDINSKTAYNKASCLKDELFRFGICYSMEERCHTAVPVTLSVKSEIKEHIIVYRVEHLPAYSAARAEVAPLLEGLPIMDALSNYEFYSTGAVDRPVPSTGRVEQFYENNVPNLWTYYCGGDCDKLSNRFLSMPSYKNRILGVQLYKFGIVGFLHCGYNYYNDRFSYSHINPFFITDGDYFGPSGDAFVVYPAPDGTAYESIRLSVFHDALQDITALRLCEKLCGRDYVMKLIEKETEPITFREYPQSAEYLLTLREKINQSINSAINN